MHAAARAWVAAHASGDVVVEAGGRDINGTVRDLFGRCDYTAIDIQDGPGVDVVADFLDWSPKRKADTVVCCEVFEHAEDWSKLLQHAAEVLKVGGQVIVTAAGPGREPHSAVDGADLRDGEYYENVDPDELGRVLRRYFKQVEVDVAGDDVRAVAVKGRK